MDAMTGVPPPRAIELKDYTPPAWLVDTTNLSFDLREEVTTVTARTAFRRNPARAADGALPLVLDGQHMELVSVRVDNRLLTPADYRLDADSLTIPHLPDQATVEIVTRIEPQNNTALEGLYKSSGTFCTQCEAEGFRRITYFPDRPDVMARYTVTIAAERARYPVLLSNGNLVAQGETPDGRHWTRWEDPWPKPTYLFALVAGDLVAVEDRFVTRSGRNVALRIFVEAGNEDKVGHAMLSLQKAMAWDEQVYGLEYDLDVFNIVAISDFNMGAMENKSLNIFNTKAVLARPDTSTDADFLYVETVVAHEYFHNWTGNRITCRDWFQLSLKEGLTVFRDQQFSADMNSEAVKRIQDVSRLRQVQFVEDAGATAHPVRPDSYIEINNFYTPTVYEKGAEVLRMYRTLLGPQGYRRGMDLYVQRHDGQAVTTDDFLAAMAEANGESPADARWRQFQLWYSQAGTPVVEATGTYDAAAHTYTLTLRQSLAPTPGQPVKQPMLIPLALGLLGPDGADLPLRLAGEDAAAGPSRVLTLTAAEQSFTFVDVPAPPVPSLLRGFSAPVRLSFPYTDAELGFLMAHDSDPFNRWEAGQTLSVRLILGLVADLRAGRPLALPEHFVTAVAKLLDGAAADRSFAALALMLPTETYLGQQMAVIDTDGLFQAREFVRAELGRTLRDRWLDTYAANREDGPFAVTSAAMGRRALKNAALGYLMAAGEAEARALCLSQLDQATAMTDVLAALQMVADGDMPERPACLEAFAARWADEPLVMDKWFAVQALSKRPDTPGRVAALLADPRFTLRNPNKVYSLIGGFTANQARFNAADGSGYRVLADAVLALDPLNPQVAARMAKAFTRWRRFDAGRQAHARAELERLAAQPGLSRDVFEIVAKSLEG